MFKKRGSVTVIILATIIIISLLILAMFLIKPNAKPQLSYTLNNDEQDNFNQLRNKALLSAYPSCNAFLNQDITICEEESNQEDKNDCITNIARIQSTVNKNSEYCNYLSNEEKKICQDYVKGTLNCDTDNKFCQALNNKDLSYCNQLNIQESIDNCNNEIGLLLAIADNNKDKCNMLSFDWLKDHCLAWLTKDSSVCIKDDMTTSDTQIIKQLAINRKKKMICYAIKQTKDKELCILDMIINEFYQTKDKKLCNEILTQDINKACVSTVNNDQKKCNSVQDPIAKELCTVAIKHSAR